MNPDVRELLAEAERAVRGGDPASGARSFLAAGDCAASYQLWRTAVRCFCFALEIDLLDPDAIARLVGLMGRGGHVVEWAEYARAVGRASWPHFGCREAQLVIGDAGALVECRGIGPVLEVMMPEPNLIDAYPHGQLAGMPLAMGLVILRRALWSWVREPAVPPRAARIVFAGGSPVELDELGHWRAVGSR